MPKILKPLQVYSYLPKTNCGECGETSCMAFAIKLISREADAKQCPPLLKNMANFKALTDHLRPSIRPVTIGVGNRAMTVGGEDALYRHEVAFPHPAGIAIDVYDTMNDESIAKRANQIEKFTYNRTGQDLRLDSIAIRCVSGDPNRFKKAASIVAENSSMPMILCSFDPRALEGALKATGDRRPLLYAANEGNWESVGKLALSHSCPVAISAPTDIGMLKALSHALMEMGIDDIILDPGSNVDGAGLAATINNFTMIKRAAIEKDDRDLGYPLMAVPSTTWLTAKGGAVEKKFKEAYLASMCIARSADLLVMHTLDIWALLPVITLRQGIYTDPKKPVAVSAGLREIGTPSENSPVLQTTNFALTYFTVLNDIKDLNCYLLVVDSGGSAVQSAVAGRKIDAFSVAEALKAAGLEQKVKHRKLIIPGYEARLSGEIEDSTKWEVLVGPIDSSQIPDFLGKKWGKQN